MGGDVDDYHIAIWHVLLPAKEIQRRPDFVRRYFNSVQYHGYIHDDKKVVGKLGVLGFNRFCIRYIVLEKADAFICNFVPCIYNNGCLWLLFMENQKIIRIAVIGPESTGKSVLSEELAHHFRTVFVPEYARDYFSDKKIEDHTMSDLTIIYQKQALWEQEMIKRANRFLICDTNLISGKVWANVVFKSTPQFIDDNLPLINYDLHLLCDIDLPWVPDDQRRNKYNRKEIMEMHVNELQKLKVKFEIVTGLEHDRFQNAVKAIQKHFKI